MTDIILSLEYKGLIVQRSAHASQAFPGIICIDFKLLNPKGNCQVLASLILRLLFVYLANPAGVNWDIREAASTLMHFDTFPLHFNRITVQTEHNCGVKNRLMFFHWLDLVMTQFNFHFYFFFTQYGYGSGLSKRRRRHTIPYNIQKCQTKKISI